MNQYKIESIRRQVQEQQNPGRFEHTIGVMYTAAALAMRYDADMDKALLAGLLHDCAKGIPSAEKLNMCEEYGISVSETEKQNPGLLHAKLGAYLARTEYEIEDEEILDAIIYHTTGRPDMTLMDKIIYIADYMEPNRNQAPNLPNIRHLAFENLEECLYQILEASLQYLKSRDEAIDPMTEQTYLYYKNVLNKE